jgi:putative SOS response-associated peptidase YedK
MFEISEVQIPPRYNIAPTQAVPVVRLSEDGERELELLRWGLIPSWARDPTIGSRMINARAETVHQKPAFRGAFRSKRCLVPADGFYEWQKLPGSVRRPYLFGLNEGEPFAFAGLWERYEARDQVTQSFTIITCEANQLVGEFHPRMPVILPRDFYSSWLEPSMPSQDLIKCLNPYPAELMRSTPVSLHVNNPRNDSPDCVQPV